MSGPGLIAQPNPAAPQPLLDGLHRQYPWTANIPFNLIDSSAQGDATGAGRKLEFYPSDETDNPRPGAPTIQLFDKSMGAPDLMGELLSHHLPRVDPTVADFRRKVIESMTPNQVKGIQGDFVREQKSGLVEKGQTFHDWLNRQGGDSFFRGYPTGQWDAKEYTPQQKQLYQQLQNYLNSRPAPAAGGRRGLIQ